MKILFSLLLTMAFTTATAAEVRVCNKSGIVLNNMEVSYWKRLTLNVGECTNYYKDPMAQRYISIALRLEGKHLGYVSKGAPILLEEGRYSYEISLPNGKLQLKTVKD